MDVEEVRLFRTDPDAWEEELKIIWKELKMQADGENSRVLGEL
jgi:hypothetical protein